MEAKKLKLVEDNKINNEKLINTNEFSSILNFIGTIHITKNCLKYSLVDIDYVRSKFYIVTERENTFLITK